MEEIEKFLMQFKKFQHVKLREEVWHELKRKGIESYRKEMTEGCKSPSMMEAIRLKYKFLTVDTFSFYHLDGMTVFSKEGSR